MAGRPIRRARLNAGSPYPTRYPVLAREVALVVSKLRNLCPDVAFYVDDATENVIQAHIDAKVNRQTVAAIQNYLQSRAYIVVPSVSYVQEIGESGYPTGYNLPVVQFHLWHE
jgi:hypothetical protein